MKEWLRKALFRILGVLPKTNVILLESEPTLGDNTGALFEKMIEEGWNQHYRFVWIQNDGIIGERKKNVYYVSRNHQPIRVFFARCFARMIIDCNLQVPSLNPNTCHVYLTHGSPIKSVKDYYYCDPSTDYVLSQSQFWNPINAEQLHVSEDQLITLGFPRNDALFSVKKSIDQVFGHSYDRYIAWYPTFRQGKQTKHSSISMPVIHDLKTAKEINEAARKRNVLIVVKPHPNQNVSLIKDEKLSNIRFIDQAFLDNHQIKSYEFLGLTDALITDYSSVLFDYLLVDKPIGLTFEDYGEYSKNPGFAIDTSIIASCSEKLNSTEEFICFLDHVCDGEDRFHEQRRAVRELTNQYVDFESSQRVLDFIESLLDGTL